MGRLSLFANVEQLGTIRDFVAQEGHKLGLDGQELYALQLAVDEACANVVLHGYGGEGGVLEISIDAIADGIQVTMRDWGRAFDPQAVPVPDITAPIEQRKLGGLGLYFMRSLMDEVRFEFDAGNGNTLTMVKRL